MIDTIIEKSSGTEIYLDHAATTYVDSKVREAMEPYWEEHYGNPSSLYRIGREAGQAVAQARETIAACINGKPHEMIFTAGGTESINLAILGIAAEYLSGSQKRHVITSAIEHAAVLNCCKVLVGRGYEVSHVAVDNNGIIDIEALKRAVRDDTVLVSIMYANNEIGSIQPIAEIGQWLAGVNKERVAQGYPRIYFHTDACQAGGCLDINVQALGVDMMTINGSKLYGPKQTGVLYLKEGINLTPIIYGGGQERNLRSGTQNVPGIVGFTKALELAQERRKEENKRLQGLRDDFTNRILAEIPETILNGPRVTGRLANNINISFRGVDGASLLNALDQYGICVSLGSACASKESEPSHVLVAIGCPEDYIGGSIRFTLGQRNTKEQVDFVIDVLKKEVPRLRQHSAAKGHVQSGSAESTSGASCIIQH